MANFEEIMGVIQSIVIKSENEYSPILSEFIVELVKNLKAVKHFHEQGFSKNALDEFFEGYKFIDD